VDDLELAAAGEEPLAVRGEAKAVKGLIECDPASDPRPFEVNEHHFMGPIPGVEDGEPLAIRVQRQVDREVAQFEVPAFAESRPV
jgi:hypothetical protein